MSGWILYALLAALLVLFWRAWGKRSMDQLLDDGHHHHHQVLAVGKAHPKGGTWSEHVRWMDAAH
ncbi:MAG: hypothetical protein VW405_17750 [Rhodospirillaceae bacterium]